MKYLIKPKAKQRGNYLKKNFGEVYMSGGRLRLNLIATETYREDVKEIFVDIVSMLAKHFVLIEEIKRRGSTKGISSMNNDLEIQDLMIDLKKKFPELKEKIDGHNKYMREYKKDWNKRFKKCKDCGRKITWNATRCHNCAGKHVKKLNELKKNRRGKKEK